MVLNRWNRFFFDPDTGASSGGSDSGGSSGGNSAPATSSDTGSAAPSSSTPTTPSNGSVEPESAPFDETPVEVLKTRVNKQLDKNKAAQKNQNTINPTVAVAPPAPVAPVPEAAKFSDQHYQEGRSFGFDKAQVEAFGGAAQFGAWAQNVRNKFQETVQQAVRAQVQQIVSQQQTQGVQAPGASPPAQAVPPAGAPNPASAFKFADPSLYEPELIQAFEHNQKTIESLQAQLAALAPLQQQFQQFAPTVQSFQRWHGEQQQQAQMQAWQQADKAFETIDPELFGTGDRTKLEPNHINARIQLADDVRRLEMAYRSSGEALPPIADLVKSAYASRHTERITTQALAKAAKASRDIRGQSTVAPTSREHRPLTGEDQRRRDVAAKLKEQAMAAGEV